MTTAIVSVSTASAADIGGRLSHGIPIRTKETPARTYFCVLPALLWAELFSEPDVEVLWFSTEAEAMGWASADIENRQERQREGTRAYVRAMFAEARAARR